MGTVQEFLEHSRIKESPNDYPNDMKMITKSLIKP